jgi:hypothetical protein
MDRDGTFRIATFLHTAHHKAKTRRKLRCSASDLVTPGKVNRLSAEGLLQELQGHVMLNQIY